MTRRILFCLLFSLLIRQPTDVRAELFLLANGGRVEGEWLNADEKPLAAYRIKMLGGGLLTLSKATVKEVVVKSDLMKRYEEFLPRVPDTAAGHWDMAERCKKANLKSKRDFHLKKVLQFDPNHEEARHALGYSRVNGNWIRADEWLTKHGYVRHKGDWRLGQEIDLEEKQEKRRAEEREWKQKVARWHSSIVRGRGEPQEALAEIQRINSIRAVPALAGLIEDADTPKQLVQLYIDVVGRFNSLRATAALIQRLLQDPDEGTRERCIEVLKKRDPHQAVPVLTRSLRDKKNFMVNRAAWALGQLECDEVIPDLIDALVTKHRFIVGSGGGGGMNLNFSPTGGDGFSAGGGAQVIEKDFRNEQVLSALVNLTPDGVNFNFNKQAWKDWYARTRIPPVVDLRRDP